MVVIAKMKFSTIKIVKNMHDKIRRFTPRRDNWYLMAKSGNIVAHKQISVTIPQIKELLSSREI